MTYADWLIAAPVMAAFGALCYAAIVAIIGRPWGEGRDPLAWGITIFALSTLLDLFFVLPRVLVLTYLGLPSSVPVVFEGLMNWIALALGMGFAATVGARRAT